MKEDRAVKTNKENAYAQSILHNAIRLGGQKEALRARDDLSNIVGAAMSNVSIFDRVENYIASINDGNIEKDVASGYVQKIFNGVSESVMDTLLIMAENRDMRYLIGIANAYDKVFEQTYEQIIVDVFTVVELNDHLRELIYKKVQNDFDSDVVLNEKISTDILGGIIISARNRIIDCSLLRMIKKAKIELTSIHYDG